MDLDTFPPQFGTEAKCLDYLFHLRWENGYRCPRCQHNEMWKIRDYKYKCKKCGYQTTVTAGTLFQDTHIPMTVWFHAAWFFAAHSPDVTATDLKNELQFNSKTAYLIHRRLKIAMSQPRSNLCRLAGTVEVALYRDKKPYLAVAVEIRDTRAGRIRAVEFGHDFPNINYFIESAVEPGSKIVYKENVVEPRLGNHGYAGVKKREAYALPFARKAYYHILNELDSALPINDQLDAYCMKVDSPLTPITFEELLTNAVHMPPHPYKKQKNPGR